MAGENNLRSNFSVKYDCSNDVLNVIDKLEPNRENLYYLQNRYGVDANLDVDLRLSGTSILREKWCIKGTTKACPFSFSKERCQSILLSSMYVMRGYNLSLKLNSHTRQLPAHLTRHKSFMSYPFGHSKNWLAPQKIEISELKDFRLQGFTLIAEHFSTISMFKNKYITISTTLTQIWIF